MKITLNTIIHYHVTEDNCMQTSQISTATKFPQF